MFDQVELGGVREARTTRHVDVLVDRCSIKSFPLGRVVRRVAQHAEARLGSLFITLGQTCATPI